MSKLTKLKESQGRGTIRELKYNMALNKYIYIYIYINTLAIGCTILHGAELLSIIPIWSFGWFGFLEMHWVQTTLEVNIDLVNC